MRRLPTLVLTIVFVAALTGEALGSEGFPRTVVDGSGQVVRIAEKPVRVISMAVSGTEILMELIGIDRIAAVSMFDTDPWMSNVADEATLVGHVIAFEAEQILALEPDLIVLASWNNPDVVAQLRGVGVPVYTMADIAEIGQISPNILALGEAVGEEEKAQTMAEALEKELERLSGIAATSPDRPRVLIYTTWGTTYAVGTTYSELIGLANGENVANTIGIQGWGEMSREMIIATMPDIVIFDFYGEPDQSVIEEFTTDPAFAVIPAVRNGAVVASVQRHVTTVSHWVIEGLADLIRLFHPGLLIEEEDE